MSRFRNILILLILVVLPTATLSIMASRSARLRELEIQDERETLALRSLKELEKDVGAMMEDVDKALEAALSSGDRSDLYPIDQIIALKTELPLLGEIVIRETDAGTVFPMPVAEVRHVNWAKDAGVKELLVGRQQVALREWKKAGLYFDEASKLSETPAVLCAARLGMIHAARADKNARGRAIHNLLEASADHSDGVPVDTAGYVYEISALQLLTAYLSDRGDDRELIDAYEALLRKAIQYHSVTPPRQKRSLAKSIKEAHGVVAERPDVNAGRVLALKSMLQESDLAENLSLDPIVERSMANASAVPVSVLNSEGHSVVVRTYAEFTVAWRLNTSVLEELFRKTSARLSRSDGLIMTWSGLAAERGLTIPDEAEDARLAAWRVRAPLQFVEMTISEGETSAVSGLFVAERRLYTWGVLLLACGIAGGVWLMLAQMTMELRKAKARSDYLAGISHDLRTPLAAIRVMSESLQLGRVEEPARQKEFLDRILRENNKLEHLVERVLFMVKYGQGALVYTKGEVSVESWLEELVSSFNARLGPQAARVHLSCHPQISNIVVDRVAMTQVLTNLIDNALKYGDGKDVKVRAEEEGQECRISVTDEGPGMSPRELRHIFKKYYRSGSGKEKNLSGVGIGLALCQEIVRRHDGRIHVKSIPGAGSCFTVILESV